MSEHESFTEASGFPAELFGADFDWARFVERFEDALVFVDIETCGLGDVLVFLVGMLRYEPRPVRGGPSLRFEKHLAESPAGEPEALIQTIERLGDTSDWVSFNGRSFDVPRLRKRARRHRLVFPDPARHVDLLHEVRRLWKNELPNCRLSTVEKRLLGLERSPNDVPGAEVPARYWDSVTLGRRELLEPIVEHNRRDVLAMVALLNRLADAGAELAGLARQGASRSMGSARSSRTDSEELDAPGGTVTRSS